MYNKELKKTPTKWQETERWRHSNRGNPTPSMALKWGGVLLSYCGTESSAIDTEKGKDLESLEQTTTIIEGS